MLVRKSRNVEIAIGGAVALVAGVMLAVVRIASVDTPRDVLPPSEPDAELRPESQTGGPIGVLITGTFRSSTAADWYSRSVDIRIAALGSDLAVEIRDVYGIDDNLSQRSIQTRNGDRWTT